MKRLFMLSLIGIGMPLFAMQPKITGNLSQQDLATKVECARLKFLRAGMKELRIEKQLKSNAVSSFEKELLTLKAQEACLRKREMKMKFDLLSEYTKCVDEVAQVIQELKCIGDDSEESEQELGFEEGVSEDSSSDYSISPPYVPLNSPEDSDS